RNVVYNNWGEGLMVMSTKDITIEDNIIYNNWSVNLYIESSQYVLAQRNLMYATTDTPITGSKRVPHNILMADESYAPASQNITIINNLTWGSNVVWWNATWNSTESRMLNVLIANNTFQSSFGHDIANHSNVKIINNIFPIGTKTNNVSGITYSNNLANTTGLAKTGTFSNTQWSTDFFKLKEDATTAINKATRLPEVSEDYFKTARDSSPDIGAYESPFTTAITLIDHTYQHSLYPNPINTAFRLTLSPEIRINNASLIIYDLSGKKVKVIALKELDTTVQRVGLQKGIYFYNIVNNNENIGNGKLIIQ
ncbi:MAG TPA: T9SS type A sorting domain-containing protein, partial [Prolixibacteraceae bacterium]|nr:T9SS type A sorting domain-containing protein [Prolixibacteraceae bacterium]